MRMSAVLMLSLGTLVCAGCEKAPPAAGPPELSPPQAARFGQAQDQRQSPPQAASQSNPSDANMGNPAPPGDFPTDSHEILERARLQASRSEGRPPAGAPIQAGANAAGNADFNALTLAAIRDLPSGRGFELEASLKKAVLNNGGTELQIRPGQVGAANCATATYLAFLMALEKAHGQPLPGSFYPGKQTDGVGIWGRWNANGPGTACLIQELGAGRTVADVEQAQPGDFVKIMWKKKNGTTPIGNTEAGHAMILISQDAENLHLWSSNEGSHGFGELTVPKHGVGANGREMGLAFVTRIENPEALIQNAPALSPKNDFLAGLLEQAYPNPLDTVRQKCGLTGSF